MCSPSFGEWDSEENDATFDTPAPRRKRVMGSERLSEVKNHSPEEGKPTWRVKLPSHFHTSFNKKGIYSPRDDVSEKERCVPPDSDTELSEYDNDVCSTYTSPPSRELCRKAEQNTRSVQEVLMNQEDGYKCKEKNRKCTGEKSSRWRCNEMEKEAAAQRVMGKIQEVEGIIRRVSHTSSDWIKDDSGISGGRVGEGQNGSWAEFDSQLEKQNKECNVDKPLMVEELRTWVKL
nr:uncharacterized protein LOC114920531 [Labrus bergylta]